jgi:HK97 family phage major capsid protein
MTATDSLLARYQTEIEERQTFIDGLVESAEKETRDLDAKELELITRARDRITVVNGMLAPLQDAAKIAQQSRESSAKLAAELAAARSPEVAQKVEYRSAGQYVMDRWRGGLGQREAVDRLELYHRAAAHQTTSDNPGLLPEKILGPVVNFVDTARPLVNALGARQLPSGSWSRPIVTQHTNVAAQSAEKAELVSQKMTIGKLPVTAVTYGGYVNVSRQDIDWTQPQVMDIVINDLAGVYAQKTEDAAGDAFTAAAIAEAALPATPTPADVAEALWTAAGNAYAATGGAGRLIAAVAPNVLGLVGPLFAPINPQNAQSTGFQAGQFGSGVMGAVSGITIVMSPQLAAGTFLVLSSAAAEVYEDRIGSLQVVEPSVLGVQVAYAGYFAPLVIDADGIRKIPLGA